MKFDFFIDRKVSTWTRTHHVIEAETEEEAIKHVLANYEEDNEEFRKSEVNFENIEGYEPLPPTLEPTIQVFLGMDMVLVADNGVKPEDIEKK